jgi:hypothetical protein
MADILFPDGTTLADVVANRNVVTSNPATSQGEGEIIYNSTDNEAYKNTGTAGTPVWESMGGGIWEDDETIVTLTTPRDIDLEGKRLYLKKGASEALSTYIEVDGTSGNLIFHIPSGEAVEWQVG